MRKKRTAKPSGLPVCRECKRLHDEAADVWHEIKPATLALIKQGLLGLRWQTCPECACVPEEIMV